MEICRRISQPGLKFLKLLTLNVLIKQFTSISRLWNKKIKKKNIVARFCLAFDIQFFDARSIYQKRYCENIALMHLIWNTDKKSGEKYEIE